MDDIIAEIRSERQRQIDHEGCIRSHDDRHIIGELAQAAAAYAFSSCAKISRGFASGINPFSLWPWTPSDFKPKDQRRDLVRAAALIIAEIERLDRCSGRCN